MQLINPLATTLGSGFEGGAKGRFGESHFDEKVNYVYAASTGELSSMRWRFEATAGVAKLWLKARDDDRGSRTSIEVALNGEAVFRGRNPFRPDTWTVKSFRLPALHPGSNELVIRNVENKGSAGMPPWFMVAEAVVAPQGFRYGPTAEEDFYFELPKVTRPIPEPLMKGQKPGFAYRGFKGWAWSPAQYMAEIPTLAKHKGNFLMNCYTSMCDIEHFPWGHPDCNRWWEPLPESKKRAYAKVVRECQRQGVNFCFSMNPNLISKHPLRYDSDDDLEKLWQHYAWAQSLGVKWFNISLDDISNGIDASGQARVVNAIYHRLKQKDPTAQFIFCPTFYWGNGTEKEYLPYHKTIARDLDLDIYLFWTGDSVVGPITRKAAESYKAAVKHRLFLWDNYPVNDNNPTMHLGPVVKRDPELCQVVDGYMANSMCKQNQGNRLPIMSCLDFAYNPAAYEPQRSIGQAVLAASETPQQAEVLRELVLSYPGMLLYFKGEYKTSYNPVREQFKRLTSTPHARFLAEQHIAQVAALAARMREAFPGRYSAEVATVARDVDWMRAALRSKYAN